MSRVVALVPDTANPYFSTLIRSAYERIAQTNPSVRFSVLATGYDPTVEAAKLRQVQRDGAEVLLIAAARPSGNRELLETLHTSGTHIVAVDVDAAVADVTVQSDNKQAGLLACLHLAERIRHVGNVVIVNGPQVSSVTARIAGCKEALAKYPNVRLLADDEDGLASRWGGVNAMAAYLRRYRSIEGVFAINDPSALGAERALQDAHRNQTVVTSVDGSVAALDALTRPGLLHATAIQDPGAIGARAGEVAVLLVANRYVGNARIELAVELAVRPQRSPAAPAGRP